MTPAIHLQLGLVATLAGAAAMLAWRARETRRPLTAARILGPPLGMSTGLAMFAVPEARVPLAWAAAAFLFGALALSYPLRRASTLSRRGDEVVLDRSRAFFALLLGLVAIRLALRGYLDQIVTPPQSAGLLFLSAFGAILRWRAEMYLTYRRLTTDD